MTNVIFKIASKQKIAEFIFDLRHTLDPKKLTQTTKSSCIYTPLSLSTKKNLLGATKLSVNLRKQIIRDLKKESGLNKDILVDFKNEVEKNWKKVEKVFFKEIKKIMPLKLKKKYICYISNSVINAYYKDNEISLKYQSFSKLNIEKVMTYVTSIVAEEILHLIYFKYWNKIFDLNYSPMKVFDLGTDEYSGWHISEIVPEFILVDNLAFKKYGWDKINRTAVYFWIPKLKKKLKSLWVKGNFKNFLIESHKSFIIPHK